MINQRCFAAIVNVPYYDFCINIIYEVTISPEKLFYRKKEHCTVFIRAQFIWGLRLELGLS